MIRFMIFKLYSYKRNLFVFNTTCTEGTTDHVLCVGCCTNTIVQQIRSDCYVHCLPDPQIPILYKGMYHTDQDQQ